VIERAVTVEEIKDLPGYLEGDLTADADTSDIPSGEPADGMVMKTEYFERPCPKYPEGRYFCIANNRLVVEPAPTRSSAPTARSSTSPSFTASRGMPATAPSAATA
jgi:hypothetical protein